MSIPLRWRFDSAGRAHRGQALRQTAQGSWMLVSGGGPAELAAFPGLIAAHTHLELTPDAAPARWGDAPFAAWAAGVMAWRAQAGAAGLARAARRAIGSLLRSGTVAVGEVESAGASTPALCASPLRARIYREVVGFDVATAAAARQRLAGASGGRLRAGLLPGLSPHAPYSVSAALFRACRAAGRRLAVHVAETADEVRFLARGDGPFRDLLERLGKLPAGWRPPRCTPVAWLDRLGVLTRRTTLIHAHHLTVGDVGRIRARGATVVVCPGTLEFFGRTPPPVPLLLRAGVPVALGTDSLWSNRALSMTGEMAGLRRLVPSLAPAQVLRMATRAGAAALGLRLRAGDLCLVRAEATAEATCEAFTAGRAPVLATLCGGRLAWRGVRELPGSDSHGDRHGL